MHILLVEDESSIRDVLKSYLIKEGWDVLTSCDGLDALKKVKKIKFDLIILDLMIPKLSGEEVCKAIRTTSNVPILIISSKSKEEDMIKGLNIGADDYITKPFRIKEVLARINALQRRIEMFTQKTNPIMSFNRNSLVINFESKEVFKDGKLIRLTVTEFKLLDALLKKPGKVLSREDLSYQVQGYRFIGDGRTMDAHIKNLRKKIEEDPKNPLYITTRIGSGYQFNFESDKIYVV
ncbi:response regulator transcription factor [Sporosarcina sp. E16_3]|uniref:response regulator transcription factor n=1 Tax=Sporosarcina sp. E16_3 TaxID=2789293 RepID=UPI001A9206AF|nr:response regulator transcription factor [Sporosarcina sp. E16_3]MBO0600594.1 response regulator transcription factor [Sporosarcina sp. E16_3]